MQITKISSGSMRTKRIMGLFLMVHGMVHLGVASAPNPDGSSGPWMLDPATSVFISFGLGTDIVTGIGIVLVGIAAAGFVLSGLGILIRRQDSSQLVVASALSSLALLLGFFNIYWMAAIGIDIMVIVLFASKTTQYRATKAAFAE